MVLPPMAALRVGEPDPLVCPVAQLYSNDGQIELREFRLLLRGQWIVLNLESTVPERSAVLHLSAVLDPEVAETMAVISAALRARSRVGFRSCRGRLRSEGSTCSCWTVPDVRKPQRFEQGTDNRGKGGWDGRRTSSAGVAAKSS